MQWTQGGFVQANGTVPDAGVTKGGYVDAEAFEAVQHEPARPTQPRRKPPAPKNVVALAKARLKEIMLELKRMPPLEKERDELRRLIAAAENKPLATVREIKRSVG